MLDVWTIDNELVDALFIPLAASVVGERLKMTQPPKVKYTDQSSYFSGQISSPWAGVCRAMVAQVVASQISQRAQKM